MHQFEVFYIEILLNNMVLIRNGAPAREAVDFSKSTAPDASVNSSSLVRNLNQLVNLGFQLWAYEAYHELFEHFAHNDSYDFGSGEKYVECGLLSC